MTARAALLPLLLAFSCATPGGAASATKLGPREQAQFLAQKGDRAAIPQLEQLLRASPGDLDLARMLAEAHVKTGTADALLKQLEGLDTPSSHYMRGLVLFSRSADAGARAIEEFRRAVALGPTEAELHYRLGLALLESERYDEALKVLQQATALAPGRAAWKLPLAKALARTGDSPAAVKALSVAVEAELTQAEVRTARALMDQLADPFANFPRAARARLDQALQWLGTADVPQQATVQIEELLQEFPDVAVLHALLGTACARLDDTGRAIDELQRAIELAPDDGKNHLYLAEIYLAHQKAKPAEDHLRKALDRNPLLEAAWGHLGDLSLERQDLPGALHAFQLAVRLTPDALPSRGKLALVYQLEGDYPAADRELHKALDLEPENLEVMLRLGVLHTERAQKAKKPEERHAAATEATRWLEKVLDAQPENALASRALEQVKQQ